MNAKVDFAIFTFGGRPLSAALATAHLAKWVCAHAAAALTIGTRIAASAAVCAAADVARSAAAVMVAATRARARNA